MDSLLANYASSDEDDDQHNNQPPPQHSNPSESLQPQKPPSSSLFSSLPKPQSASALFSSLPPPKSQPPSSQFPPKSTSSSIPTPQNHGQTGGEQKGLHRDSNSGSNVSSGLFSALPAPKSQPDSGPISTSSRASSASQKRVVQFRPPVIQSSFKSDDKDDEDDDDDDEYLDKKKPQVINSNSSFKSFISSMPAPMNSATLGMSGTGGSGRRAMVETSVSSLNSDVYKVEKEVETGSIASSVQDSSNDGSVSGSLGAVEGQLGTGPDLPNWEQPSESSYVGYESYEGYANYEGYASYGNDGHYDQNNWANAPSTWVAPEASVPGLVESVVRGSGKRRRDQIPTEIVEVNQDELMKNRPRQDKSKLTGIAFGPAYQPAPSGGGGKPTKLHKRKHQIGSLYFDMKQKEMELSERRAKGMLTKAETQAKYGW